MRLYMRDVTLAGFLMVPTAYGTVQSRSRQRSMSLLTIGIGACSVMPVLNGW